MFWSVLLLGVIGILAVTLGTDRKLGNNHEEAVEEWLEGQVIVVDKHVKRLSNKAQRNYQYVLYIQTDARKVIELKVDQQVYRCVETGDEGVISESMAGKILFEKVS